MTSQERVLAAVNHQTLDLIDAGIEIFNPVQTNAWNMNPVFLKKEFGKDCTFGGGGIETAGVLNNGNPTQIKEHVLERLEIFQREVVLSLIRFTISFLMFLRKIL